MHKYSLGRGSWIGVTIACFGRGNDGEGRRGRRTRRIAANRMHGGFRHSTSSCCCHHCRYHEFRRRKTHSSHHPFVFCENFFRSWQWVNNVRSNGIIDNTGDVVLVWHMRFASDAHQEKETNEKEGEKLKVLHDFAMEYQYFSEDDSGVCDLDRDSVDSEGTADSVADYVEGS